MEKIINLIGKTIVSLRGSKRRKNQKDIELEYILFDDGKTLIQLDDQDYYDYHDCSSSAKEIRIYENSEMWKDIKENNVIYGDANYKN